MATHETLNSLMNQANGGNLESVTAEMTVNGVNPENGLRPIPHVLFDWKIPIDVPNSSLTENGFTIDSPFTVTDTDYFYIYPTIMEYNNNTWSDITEGSRYSGTNFIVDYNYNLIKKVPFYWLSSVVTESRPRFYAVRFDCYQYGNNTPFTYIFPYNFAYNFYNGRIIFNSGFEDTDNEIKLYNKNDDTYSVMNYSTTAVASNTRTFSDLVYCMRSNGVLDGVRVVYHGTLYPFNRFSIATNHTYSTNFYAFFIKDKCKPNRISYHIYDTAKTVTEKSDEAIFISDGTNEYQITNTGVNPEGIKYSTPYEEGDHLNVELPVVLEKGKTYRIIYKYIKDGTVNTKSNVFSNRDIFPRLTSTIKF